MASWRPASGRTCTRGARCSVSLLWLVALLLLILALALPYAVTLPANEVVGYYASGRDGSDPLYVGAFKWCHSAEYEPCGDSGAVQVNCWLENQGEQFYRLPDCSLYQAFQAFTCIALACWVLALAALVTAYSGRAQRALWLHWLGSAVTVSVWSLSAIAQLVAIIAIAVWANNNTGVALWYAATAHSKAQRRIAPHC